MSEHHDIYVRAHTMRVADEQKRASRRNYDDKWADCALIFDCETRVTPDQSLTFGFARFCELRNNEYVTVSEGIVHGDKLSAKELNRLRAYARKHKPDSTDDGYDRIYLYSRPKFVTVVLGMAIQANAFIVCFNSGFDLSRLALDWETAANGGWSLILSQWRDPKTREITASKFFPRIVIKALNSKTAIIHSTREEGEDLSLLEFQTIEYKRKGYAIATHEQLERIAKVPKRELMRRGVNQHTLEKICHQDPVRAIQLANCLRKLEDFESEQKGTPG